MKKSSSLPMLAALALMGSAPPLFPTGKGIKESEAEKTKRQKKTDREINIARGLKEFIFPDGTTVWAINYKNAQRKAKKTGWNK